MSRTVPGFDYTAGLPVSLTRAEWKALTEQAIHTARVGGDLILKDAQGRITHEIYDQDHA